MQYMDTTSIIFCTLYCHMYVLACLAFVDVKLRYSGSAMETHFMKLCARFLS